VDLARRLYGVTGTRTTLARTPGRDEVGGAIGTLPGGAAPPGLALKAALLSRGSALRVAGLDEPIAERFRGLEVVELRLSRSDMEALATRGAVDVDTKPS
jgi:hypothetical protein